LVNASERLVGTWQGDRHQTQYFADGTFVTDPDLVRRRRDRNGALKATA
jgi:hypothetical protein